MLNHLGPTKGDRHVTQIHPLECEAASRWKLSRSRRLDRSRLRLIAGRPFPVDRVEHHRGRRAIVSSRDASRLRRQVLLAQSPARLSGRNPSGLRGQVLLAQRVTGGAGWLARLGHRIRSSSTENRPPHQAACFFCLYSCRRTPHKRSLPHDMERPRKGGCSPPPPPLAKGAGRCVNGQ